ncbi:MAG: DNA recombination/repair protein RecA, partial [Bacilli bacterium]
APPFKSCKVDIIYGKGISKEGEVLDLAIDMGLIKKSGSWYEYSGERIGQGRETAKEFLKKNETVMHDLVTKLKTGIAQ